LAEILTPVSPSLSQREGEEKDEGAGAPSSSPTYEIIARPVSPFEKGGLKGDLRIRNPSQSPFREGRGLISGGVQEYKLISALSIRVFISGETNKCLLKGVFKRGVSPSFKKEFPLSKQIYQRLSLIIPFGEGDTGGEV